MKKESRPPKNDLDLEQGTNHLAEHSNEITINNTKPLANALTPEEWQKAAQQTVNEIVEIGLRQTESIVGKLLQRIAYESLIPDKEELKFLKAYLSLIHDVNNSYSDTTNTVIARIVLTQGNEFLKLTTYYLTKTLTPYLDAISAVQHIINEVLGRPIQDIKIREISQNSPISVSLEGAAEAVEAIKETVVPWRRKHVAQMAIFLEQEKQVEIEIKKG